MEYSIDFRGHAIQLPKYTVAVQDKFDKLDKTNQNILSAKERLKNIYKMLEDFLGKENLIDIVGSYDECDPNEVNILYLEIVHCYNKPVTDYQMNDMQEQLDGVGVSDMINLLNAISKSGISFKSDTGVPFKVVNR